MEYNANGTSLGVNLYGKRIDEILERFAIGADNQWHSYFLQQNHEGSVTHLTDASGSVIEKYRYDAFGVPTIYAPDWSVRSFTSYDNRFLFTGREYAATYRSTSTGLNFYEYRARAYNPILGRFMSEDPKLFGAGDYNLFRYCHNDPEDMTDPMGLEINWAGNGPQDPEHHDAVAMYAETRDYNKSMAQAQWQGSDLLRGTSGAIGIGTAGYLMSQSMNVKLWADPKVHNEKTPTVTKTDGMFGPVQVPALTRPSVDPDTISERGSDGTIRVSQRVAIDTRIGSSANERQRQLEMSNQRALVNWVYGRGTAEVRSAMAGMQIHTSIEAERAVYNATVQSLRQFMAERAFQVDSPQGEHVQY